MLEARNIHKVYNNAKEELVVLKGINLKIDKGSFLAIVGPSGAGKSTLLQILGGLDAPTKGSIILEQQDIYDLNDKAAALIRNEKIGFVFQFYHLLPEFTVLENVMMPALISSQLLAFGSELKQKAKELLEKVGLNKRMAYFPAQLSGGEKQRVAIARALINNPVLLLCDEPTGNLDSETGQEVVSLIRQINIKNQMAVVLVTHNVDLTKVADRVHHLRDGMLIN